jgi:hypothetical protein
MVLVFVHQGLKHVCRPNVRFRHIISAIMIGNRIITPKSNYFSLNRLNIKYFNSKSFISTTGTTERNKP